MKTMKYIMQNRLSVFFVTGCWILLFFCGCQKSSTNEAIGPVFYPEPPEKPRLQFLKSFSGPEDVGVKTVSGFQKFVVGEPEVTERIAKPYGVGMYDGKLYVCDVGRRLVEVLDLENKTFTHMTKDRRLINPMNIFIENGVKYVADTIGGAVFVFDESDTLRAMLGKGTGIKPLDVAVRGDSCYITDANSNSVIMLDKRTGEEIGRIGKEGEEDGQFQLIADLSLDDEGNIYVTDKIKGQITEFNKAGIFQRTIGKLGDNIDQLVRPKGISIDRNKRIWLVDPASEVVKIMDPEGRLLLFFGMPGNAPGNVNLPARVKLDYDNVGLFQQYAVPGAQIEFLVIVTNQYGLNKINVYGFGSFPELGVAEASPE